MKTQKKNGQGLYLKKKNNKRWKWMAGATSATAAGVTASQASTVTINLVGNYISASGGNHLNADVTGDGHPDITMTNAFNSVFYRTSFSGAFSSARVNINGVRAAAFYHRYDLVGYVTLGPTRAYFFDGGHTNPSGGFGTASLTGVIPISFKDLHINGGIQTKGSLEVTVSGPNAEIQLDSFTYTTRENVPDQGSSLTLLAIGAGGVLALRRRKIADEGS